MSNDFYRLLLDGHTAYSCAYFTREGLSLYDAQTAELEMICRKLGLKPGMRLLAVKPARFGTQQVSQSGCRLREVLAQKSVTLNNEPGAPGELPSDTTADLGIHPTEEDCCGHGQCPLHRSRC